MSYTIEQIEEVCELVGGNPAGIIKQLLEENDALREDAERYKFTKSYPSLTVCRARDKYRAQTQSSVLTDWFPSHDAAIDAARKGVA